MRVTGTHPAEAELLEVSEQHTGTAAQVAPEPMPPPVSGEQSIAKSEFNRSAAMPRTPASSVAPGVPACW